MPLSEDEQRILSEIEQQLYETDPSLADGIADTTVYSDAVPPLQRGIFGFIFGVVIMIGTLHISGVALAAVGVDRSCSARRSPSRRTPDAWARRASTRCPVDAGRRASATTSATQRPHAGSLPQRRDRAVA